MERAFTKDRVHLCDPYEEGQTPNSAKNNGLLKERYLFNKRNEEERLFLALPIIGAKNCSSTLHASSEVFVVYFFCLFLCKF